MGASDAVMMNLFNGFGNAAKIDSHGSFFDLGNIVTWVDSVIANPGREPNNLTYYNGSTLLSSSVGSTA